MNIIAHEQYSSSKVADTEYKKTTYSNPTQHTRQYGSGYSLDITDKVTDDMAYQGQGKTMNDIVQQAQGTDVQAKRDFMIVMSNSVSGEDLAKMEKEGFHPGDTDVETYVSIVDKIKVTLAQAGIQIAGYNDNLDESIVEEITGSKIDVNELCQKFAQADLPITTESLEDILTAVEELSNVTQLSDDATKYLLLNQKKPTVENIYLSKYQSANQLKQAKGYYGEEVKGYFVKKADTIDFEKLDDQMKQVIEQSGLEANEETKECAKWLVQNGIELNKDNLTRLLELKKISFPISSEDIVDISIQALANGKRPKDALLTGESSFTEKALEYVEEVNAISDEAIHTVVANGEEINLKNLYAAQKQIFEDARQNTENAGEKSLQEIEAKLQLEEIRLMMTVDANKHLLKSGFQIDTASLEDLVSNLKKVKEQMQQVLFQGETASENQIRADLFDEVLTKTREIPSMPAAVLAKALEDKDSFTLSNLHKEGTVLKAQYDSAGKTYEALQTKPRADLGDNISKAFRNVDDLLKDLGLESTKENQRAVRILAYNQLDVTKEHIEEVKQADQMVQRVMHKMTPAQTLWMIRDNKNPLEMGMDELEEYLDSQEKSATKETEKFSKYLQKLEHQNNISDEERKAYMGIYRMFRQIEKSDGAVIGNIVATGAEMNFKNMLQAVRTRANKNLDITIDEDYGCLEKLITKGQAIDEQIQAGYQNSQHQSEQKKQEKYYGKLAGDIKDSLAKDVTIQDLKDIDITQSTTIEKFANELEEKKAVSMETEDIAKREAEFRKSLKKAQQVEEVVLEDLITFDQAVSIDNIDAATMLIMERGTLFRQVYSKKEKGEEESQKDDSVNQMESDMEAQTVRMIEQLEDAKSAKKAYQEIIDHSYQLVEERINQNGMTQLDLKSAQALFKGLSLAKNFAREENYEIPMKIKDEITSVNLKIYHDESQKGKVSITMDTKAFGKVAAEFSVTDKVISGMVVYENNTANADMQQFEKALHNSLSNQEASKDKHVSIHIANTRQVDLNKFGKQKDVENEHPTTKELYQTAKSFMIAWKEIAA